MKLEIKTDKMGAELLSVKLNGIEKIHQGDKVLDENNNVYWKRHAPVLFPIVGSLKDNSAIINNKKITMGQHGFARDMQFEELEISNTKHSYILNSNDETFKMYPYNFSFKVTYLIDENRLKVRYEVINNNKDSEMLFGIGGHPAFYCDILSNNYYLEFEIDETESKILPLESSLISNKQLKGKDILVDKRKILLNKDTFVNDAIIFTNLYSNKVSLKDKNGNTLINFNFTNFPYLAFWSKVGAPFVCIEPWYTTADKIDSDGEFSHKENICLKAKDKFVCEYEMEFY